MRVWDESVVQPEEIDSLGHLNSQFYLQRSARANGRLLGHLGLGAEVREALGAVLTRVDIYTRYQREQRLGAALEVRSAVVEVSANRLRVFHEVRNAATGELAAPILAEFELEARATRQRLQLPADVMAAARAAQEPLPEAATPRSLTLASPRLDLTFEQVLARVGPTGDGGPGHLAERVVPLEDCDGFGFLRDDVDAAPADMRRGQPKTDQLGPKIVAGADGVRYGWALMEMRACAYARPRAGERVRTVGAVIGLTGKARIARRWTFGDACGLVSIDDTVALLLDVDARRAIEFPEPLRRDLVHRRAPELA